MRATPHACGGWEGGTMIKIRSLLSLLVVLILAVLNQGTATGASLPQQGSGDAATSADVSFVENRSEPFGAFDGVAYVRHTGFFEGETTLGEFRVPYEIVAPEDPAQSNGAVLVEPPHFLFGPLGRDFSLGHDLVFQTVSGYASVGFGEDGLNILDPAAEDLRLAGQPVANAGAPNPAGTLDEEILIQFSRALTADSYAGTLLGDVNRLYAYGVSQTSAVLMETRRNLAQTSQQGLFDFMLLHTALWPVPPQARPAFDFLNEEFQPLDGAGRILIVNTEGELVLSDAEQLRRVVDKPQHRLYEVAGAAHAVSQNNPLDHNAVARAVFAAGDRWARTSIAPPPSMTLETAAPGAIDVVYGIETGIARDGDLNARGGVRLPDLAVGQAQFIASDPETIHPQLPPELAPLSGNMVDLACEPRPDSDTDAPRFRNHGQYVSAFSQEVNRLQAQGFLLAADAEIMKERAATSEVGKPGTCNELSSARTFFPARVLVRPFSHTRATN